MAVMALLAYVATWPPRAAATVKVQGLVEHGVLDGVKPGGRAVWVPLGDVDVLPVPNVRRLRGAAKRRGGVHPRRPDRLAHPPLRYDQHR
jgi:hypothetical protein